MAEKIEPVLSPHGWAELDDGIVFLRDETLFARSDCGGFPYAEDVELDRHSTAALCLHGQPFGFTWEDVGWLRILELAAVEPDSVAERRLLGIIDRIEALLPPREADDGT